MDLDPLERLWLTVKSFMEKIDSLLARNTGTSLFLVTQHAAILHIIEKVVADIDPDRGGIRALFGVSCIVASNRSWTSTARR